MCNTQHLPYANFVKQCRIKILAGESRFGILFKQDAYDFSFLPPPLRRLTMNKRKQGDESGEPPKKTKLDKTKP